jgi:hypothetical protein
MRSDSLIKIVRKGNGTGARTSKVTGGPRRMAPGNDARGAAWPFVFIFTVALGLISACSDGRGHGQSCPGDAAPSLPAPPVPKIPIGMEAFRQWERLPQLRVGTRTVMRSTFDRSGGNEGADASHFLRQASDGTFVSLDVQGPGVLAFVRTNHWHGSPWHYVVDGRDTIVAESSTADPIHPLAGATFIPAALFPSPLAETWDVTRGADLSWVPVPFTRDFELHYGRTHYGTGYYIVHLFPERAEQTVPPLESWDGMTPPGPDVLALIARAGEDIAPQGGDTIAAEGIVEAAAGETVALPTLMGPAVVRVLELDAPLAATAALTKARLRIRWDGRSAASVDAPLPLFFGAGTLFNREQRRFLVRAFLSHIRFDGDGDGDGDAAPARIDLATYFPMPFVSSAVIELVAGDVALPAVQWRIRTTPLRESPESFGYFHSTYRDHGVPTPGKDLAVLDTAGVEGSDDWCGTFAGMSWTFSDAADLATLEGDPRFYFDDSASPQAQGTGTEEWGGGGDYWGGRTMTLPFAGHPVGAPSADVALGSEDLVQSAYRHLMSDAMPFGRRARIQLEHGGADDSIQHYTSLAYWYGRPGACLRLTDTLHVGDRADEVRHHYRAPAAAVADTLTSRYEGGAGTFAGTLEGAPATTDTGRHSNGVVEFRVALDPENVGVLLRRKLDQRFANQRALVEVAADAATAPFERAGLWSTPGSDVGVYSNPGGELDPPAPIVQTSDRRWREDEFLVARALTEGRAAVRVRLTFAPRDLPLLPGQPLAPQAWSEYRYWVYSWRYPAVMER